jgi:hypothetical protein
MRMIRGSVMAVALLASAPAAVRAQVYVGSGDAPRGGSFEVAGGGAFASGFEMGSETATLTRSTAGNRFDLFTTDSRVGGFPGAFARVGVYFTPAISIEGGIRYAQPKVSVRLSGDAESATDETATETATHYIFDGSVLVHLNGISFAGGRGVPFVSGGGGYLRELHEKNELVETGSEFHATAGLKYWLGRGGHRFGLRVEAGFSAREKGLDNEGERRTLPLILGGLSYLF